MGAMLNAVTCVWNEEDIIESSVKNAFAQGCSNVFIVDNGSTDDTVKRAERAGAKLAVSFKTECFDERRKIAHLNAVVKYFNTIFTDASIWWMYFDADEFPNIDSELCISDFLEHLDINIRGLHGYLHDHIPSHYPYHVAGFHPIDFMPTFNKSPVSKIPLLRYDKGKPHLFSAGGAHEVDTNGEPLLIAQDIIDIHHFPVRNPQHTFGRLKRLVRRSEDGTSRADWYNKRAHFLKTGAQSQYNSRYETLRKNYARSKYAALKTHSLPYGFARVNRWYDPFSKESREGLAFFDACLCDALFNYYMRRYDIALCGFHDALEACRMDEVKVWLLVKMAECFSFSDKAAASSLLRQAYATKDGDIRAYIDCHLLEIMRGSGVGPAVFEDRAVKGTAQVEAYTGAFQIDPAPLHDEVDSIMDLLARRHGSAGSGG